jgi:hypothetical protein
VNIGEGTHWDVKCGLSLNVLATSVFDKNALFPAPLNVTHLTLFLYFKINGRSYYSNSIITYLGYYEEQPGPDTASILLECCLQGDLFTIRSLAVKRNKHLFSEGFMWAVFSQLVGALAFL